MKRPTRGKPSGGKQSGGGMARKVLELVQAALPEGLLSAVAAVLLVLVIGSGRRA